jgi:hypothetical protein
MFILIVAIVGFIIALILLLFGFICYRPSPVNYSALEDDQELDGLLNSLQQNLQVIGLAEFLGILASAYWLESATLALASGVSMLQTICVRFLNSAESYRKGGHYIYWMVECINLLCYVYASVQCEVNIKLAGAGIASLLGFYQLIYLGFWSGRTSRNESEYVTRPSNAGNIGEGSFVVFPNVILLGQSSYRER